MQYTSLAARWTLIALLLSGFQWLPHAAADANLVKNGGAEEQAGPSPSVPAHWYPASRPAEGLRLWRDQEHARSGQACFAISSPQASQPLVSNNWAQAIQEIPAGRSLRLSGYVRTEAADSANLCVQCWGAGGQRIVAFASTPAFHGSNDWTFAQSAEIVVPPGTTELKVRAALTGKGQAFFDDVRLEILPPIIEKGSDAAPQVKGRVLRTLPVLKDCMVLAWLPGWDHGDVDNLGIGNSGGGARTLLSWQPPAPEELSRPGVRFVLALYARSTTRITASGPTIHFHEILDDWNENCSWQRRPRIGQEPVASIPLPPGDGWKTFDLTAVVRRQAAAPGKTFGVCLRFAEEEPVLTETRMSSCCMVSREGIGPWASRRPALLVVEPN